MSDDPLHWLASKFHVVFPGRSTFHPILRRQLTRKQCALFAEICKRFVANQSIEPGGWIAISSLGKYSSVHDIGALWQHGWLLPQAHNRELGRPNYCKMEELIGLFQEKYRDRIKTGWIPCVSFLDYANEQESFLHKLAKLGIIRLEMDRGEDWFKPNSDLTWKGISDRDAFSRDKKAC